MHPYEHDPGSDLGYGLEAAQAIGVPAEQVFKTLMAVVDGELTVAVVPVTGMLDLKALAQAVGAKRAVMDGIRLATKTQDPALGQLEALKTEIGAE